MVVRTGNVASASLFTGLAVWVCLGCQQTVSVLSPPQPETTDCCDEDGDGYTETGGDCDDGDATIHPGADEPCDGVDNDCDGDVDEDHPDSDGDGLADCLDDDCSLDLVPGQSVQIRQHCPFSGELTVDAPWEIAVEWWFDLSDSCAGTAVTPAVGNLTDDNDDGRIDDADVPDVVVITYGGGDDVPSENHLLALHGDGSGVIFDLPAFLPYGSPAIADVDLDGTPEILAVRWLGPELASVVALLPSGLPLWETAPYPCLDYRCGVGQVAVADLDADGSAEVITHQRVYRGADGSTLFPLPHEEPGATTLTIADLDADGTAEIVVGGYVYAHDGSVEWTLSDHGHGIGVIFHAVADLDGDHGGELVAVSGPVVTLHDDDGSVMEEFESLHFETVGGRPPAVADFDGDGTVEFALADDERVLVMEMNGDVRWTAPHGDTSGSAACSGFDFDADGAYEVLYADHYDFRIFDGATGEVRFLWSDHDSITSMDFPTVVDVDADGSAEILLACNEHLDAPPPPDGQTRGLYVFGQVDDHWPAAGPNWSFYDYTVGRVRPDGGIVTPLPLPWTGDNLFRARPPVDGSPDLLPVLGESCLASCDHGPWKIAWGAINQGWWSVREPVSVTVYRLDGDTATPIAWSSFDELRAGYQVPGQILELTPDAWGDGIRIVIDDDGSGVGGVAECDEGNNALEIPAPVCP